MPLSASQRSAVTQFVNFTQADKKTAEKTLKSYDWNVERAVDFYFNSGNSSSSTSKKPAQNESSLAKLFDKYRDEPNENPDGIGIDGTMQYLQDLGVSIEDVTSLIVMEMVQSPALGEITREGFVQGWQQFSAATLDAQKKAISQRKNHFSQTGSPSNEAFKKVYKHTFKLGCPPGSRSVPLETASELWKQLLGPQGLEWKGKSGTSWLDMWLEYLTTHWKKAVNRDMWEQLLQFKDKTMEDEAMSFWSEDAAWPGVIDEFVMYVREKGK